MRVVYPGSFDPPTNGHLDIIKRACNISEHLIIGVLVNSAKKPLFSTKERMEMLNELTKDFKNVEVVSFSGLLVDFCKEMDCNIILRGIRAMTDFEYEFQLSLTNKTMARNIETIFIPASSENLWLSSSIVKEVARYNGDYSSMVPDFVKLKLQENINKGGF